MLRRRRAVGLAAVTALVALGALAWTQAGGGQGGTRSGVLRLALTPLGSLDPAQARSLEQLLVADQLFDSLTAVDQQTSSVVPALAARWTATPDQRQWDFELRAGATFVNGRAITPADVKYSLERIVRAETGSPAVDLLARVTGFAEVRQGAAELSGVTTPGPTTVRVSLAEPWSVLPAVLSSPVFGIVPRDAVEAAEPGFAEQPVGSGPFRLLRRQGPTLSMVAVPGSAARIKGIEVTVYDDVASSYRAFQRGQSDWSRVPPEEVGSAGRRYGRQAFRASNAQLLFGFNLRNPKFADPRFREAIVRGIDRRAIVAAVYQGTATASDGVVVDGRRGDGADVVCGRCGFDPGRARALLAEAFPGARPPDIALDFDDDPGQAAIAHAMQAGLGDIGVRAFLRPRSPATYETFVLSGQQEVFRFGWVAAYPSPEAVLGPLFSSGSPDNLAGFSLGRVDEQLRLARAEADPAERKTLHDAVEQAVLDELPVIPIARFDVHAVVSSRVRDLRTTSSGGFDAAAVRLVS